MNLYKELDIMIQQVSTEEQYETNKSLINQHLNGEVDLQQLPENLKQVIFDWEMAHNQYVGLSHDAEWDDIEEWED